MGLGKYTHGLLFLADLELHIGKIFMKNIWDIRPLLPSDKRL